MAERTAILIDSDGNRLGVEGNPLYIEGIVAITSVSPFPASSVSVYDMSEDVTKLAAALCAMFAPSSRKVW